MKKTLFALLLSSSFAFAEYLFQPSNICVKSFYFNQSNGYFYYVRSDTGATVSGTTKNYGDDFFSGYEYNTTSKICSKVASNNTLGIDNEDFNYLSMVIGVVVAVLFVWGLL